MPKIVHAQSGIKIGFDDEHRRRQNVCGQLVLQRHALLDRTAMTDLDHHEPGDDYGGDCQSQQDSNTATSLIRYHS